MYKGRVERRRVFPQAGVDMKGYKGKQSKRKTLKMIVSTQLGVKET